MRPPLTLILSCFLTLGCSDSDSERDTTADTADTAGETETAGEVEADGETGDTTTPGEVDLEVDGETSEATPEEALAATIAGFCPGYASAWCAAAETCGCDAAPGFPAEDACRVGYEARCARELTSYLDVVRGGQAAYGVDAGPTCLAVFAPLFAACVPPGNDQFFVTCPVLAPPGGWEDILPGLDEACEGTCLLGFRCASDGFCRVPGVASASCTSAIDCVGTLVCEGASEGVAGTCRPPVFADSGKVCATPDDCGGDTSCLASVRKTCVMPEAGRECRFDGQCNDVEYCSFGDDPQLGLCVPLPSNGQPCGGGSLCAAGLGCNQETVRCGPLPGFGETCAGGPNGPILCGERLACVDLVCSDIPALGETCAMGPPHCAAGLGCAFGPDGSVCSEPGPIGTRCENDMTCAEGLYCEFATGSCTPDLATGAPCVNGNECGDGECLPDATFTFRCAPTPGLGDECFLDDCEPGLRCETPYSAGACVPRYFCGMLTF